MRNRFRISTTGLALVFVFALAAHAEETDIRQEKARELYLLVGGGRLAQQAGEAVLANVKANPQIAPYEDVFREWFAKVMAGGELETEMVKAYAETFTADELEALLGFYRSPVGKKALEQMPALMKRGMEIGSRLAKDHSAELDEMLAKRKKELDEMAKEKP
jgi:hypothetical protein